MNPFQLQHFSKYDGSKEKEKEKDKDFEEEYVIVQ